MTFQAYIDNIQTKTGKTPADFKRLAETRGFVKAAKLAPDAKAGALSIGSRPISTLAVVTRWRFLQH